MAAVHHPGPHFRPELVDDPLHQVIFAEQLDIHRFVRVVHAEDGLGVVRELQPLRPRYSRLLLQDHRLLGDAVQPEVLDLVPLLAVCDAVIVVAVPDEGVGAHHVPFAVVGQDPLLLRAVLGVLEGDFHPQVDGLVDGVNDVVALLVVGPDPPLGLQVPAQLRRAVLAGEVQKLPGQLLALLLGNELGGCHRIQQYLQLRDVEGAAVVVVAVLGGPLHLHPKACPVHDVQVLHNGVPVHLDVVLILQHLDELVGGHHVVLIGVPHQVLIEIEHSVLGFTLHGSPLFWMAAGVGGLLGHCWHR